MSEKVCNFDLVITLVSFREPESVLSLEKQFGLGVGPSLVRYQHLESGLLRRQAYEAYFGYRKWTKQISDAELDSYKRYVVWRKVRRF